MTQMARAWQRWHRYVLGGFSVLVGVAVVWRLQGLDWTGAWHAVQAMPTSTLALAAAVAALGHANYSGFDLLARRWLGLTLPAWRMAWSATVSYAFTLNLGSLIGGAAVRWRLLSAAGVKPGAIAQVLSLAVLTNWLGYALVAGLVLLGPGEWQLGPALAQTQATHPGPVGTVAGFAGLDGPAMQAYAQALHAWLSSPAAAWVGGLLLALVLAWLGLLATGQLPTLTQQLWRGRGLRQPSGPLALAQLLLGAANWLWMAGVMGVLLAAQTGETPPFAQVLAAQALASLAGLVARVPGGLGVFEAVYWVMLGDQVPVAQLLGALLVFRVLYFLLPLLLALPGYWLLTRKPASAGPPASATRPVLVTPSSPA